MELARDRSLDQKAGEQRGEIEKTQPRRGRVDRALWRWCRRDVNDIRPRRRGGLIGLDVNTRLSRRGLVLRRALVAAAAVRDPRRFLAIMLFGGTDRAPVLREHGAAGRRENPRDQGDGGKFRSQSSHSTPV